MENEDRIKKAENNFCETMSEVSKTDDTFLRRAFLNVATKQNDLVYALKQNLNRGGRQ